jgi:hypothetical protein
VKAALALPVALTLGALAELAAGLVRRIALGERGWWRGVTGRWTDLRRLLRSGRARPAAVEAAGAAAALAGAGFAAGAALGVLPGSMALAYPALALAAIGAHLSVPIRRGGEGPAARARLHAALAEPAFAVALAAMALRWRALDFEAVRGTQTVLGPGIVLGPVLAAVGLALAAVLVLVMGAIRVPPQPLRRGGQARRAGASLLAALARWAAAGATSVVVAALVAGHRLDPSPGVIRFAVAAAVASVLLGGGGAAARMLAPRRVAILVVTALVLAAVAVALVVTA